MKEKERLIIETGIKLFASKGFTATSIQEIATECGISKGAFYLYFKSKESLLLAIFEYYYTRIQERVNEIDHEDLEPREKFMKQIYCHFDEIRQHKEFIIMQVREHAIPFNEAIEDFIKNMRLTSNRYYKKMLAEIYGEQITPHVWDLTIMIQGIFHSYLELIIFEVTELDLKYLSKYILHRLDDLVSGLVSKTEEPILSVDVMESLIKEKFQPSKVSKRDLLISINENKERVADHPDKENILVTMDVLEDEINRDEPRIPVIKGMLANFHPYGELDELRSMIADFFLEK
ncbi:TetR/AcrR family transcriptional regulator [Falsibacillus albus]|uniref:TetR/AcrR family transcriptional regulator n=1 Tax=Falsibacillus albus TaxID=2478915 RepID=A0A3L7JRN0_9BACI|nr:TetR/AcrR family transcriptional regulator [Falsibacillus albus]